MKEREHLPTPGHAAFMQEALHLAMHAAAIGEVPVGAVVVHDGNIVSKGFNLREQKQSPCAHAEMLAIEAAAAHLNSWRLVGTQLYVTLEPCIMCAGAILQARIPIVHFAARDPKAGAFGSLYRLHDDDRLNHKVTVTEGLCEQESSNLLKGFFQARRH